VVVQGDEIVRINSTTILELIEGLKRFLLEDDKAAS
jgi:hypothetical protein